MAHFERSEQERKGEEFAALHRGPRTFVVPNPWDAGTARALSGMGFAALATTSGGLASRAAMSAVVHAARHIAEFGTFPDMRGVLSGAEINDVLGAP